jgi:hypothetical protein
MEMNPTPWRPLKNRRRALRMLVGQLRDGPCRACGRNDGANQFHHLGRKTMDIASAPRGTPTALRRELGYGVTLLCPEDHRAVHAGELDANLVPLPVPSPDVWVAAGSFHWRFTYTASTSGPTPQWVQGPGQGRPCPGPNPPQ